MSIEIAFDKSSGKVIASVASAYDDVSVGRQPSYLHGLDRVNTLSRQYSMRRPSQGSNMSNCLPKIKANSMCQNEMATKPQYRNDEGSTMGVAGPSKLTKVESRSLKRSAFLANTTQPDQRDDAAAVPVATTTPQLTVRDDAVGWIDKVLFWNLQDQHQDSKKITTTSKKNRTDEAPAGDVSTSGTEKSSTTDSHKSSEDERESLNQFYQVPLKPSSHTTDHTKVPGSPWTNNVRFSDRPHQKNLRPPQPLPHARYTALATLVLAALPSLYLILEAVWADVSFGTLLLQIFVSIIMFFGFLWNAFSLSSSIAKCFIPSRAFKSNTRYCSVLPEAKDPSKDWPRVTIQAVVYKESFTDVIMPTLESCIASRDKYVSSTDTECNVVVCDDAIMHFMDNDFAAAAAIWRAIQHTGRDALHLKEVMLQLSDDERRRIKLIKKDNLIKAFDRMAYYNYHNIGFVARSTLNRRGKFKKAGNMNAHLRLAFGAEQLAHSSGLTFHEAAEQLVGADGSSAPSIIFGNDISIGDVIAINDADSRMPEDIMVLTVPEFLNDDKLGFTQHSTKTLSHQRDASSYLRRLTPHTDFLYQGHFLTSSILGFHPPLVGHSALIRTDGLRTCGKMRSFRRAQHWLQNIGLGFLSMDQLGSERIYSDFAAEYWSESNCSEDFELMINLYNLGYDGRYVSYEGAEYEEGVTRTFDEEAERYRRFSVGAHELVFNSFQEMFGRGIFSPDFWSFMKSDMPGYYKIYLTAYLLSYTVGGTFILLYTCACLTRLFEPEEGYAMVFNSIAPTVFILLNFVIYVVVSNISFSFAMIKMFIKNKSLFFYEYSSKGIISMVWKLVLYSMSFQFLFYTVMANFAFLGSMDHLLSSSELFTSTNKDVIQLSRWAAFWETVRFNRGSFLVASFLGGLAAVVFLDAWTDDLTGTLLFTAPAFYLALATFTVPFALNPFISVCRPTPAAISEPHQQSKEESTRGGNKGKCEV